MALDVSPTRSPLGPPLQPAATRSAVASARSGRKPRSRRAGMSDPSVGVGCRMAARLARDVPLQKRWKCRGKRRSFAIPRVDLAMHRETFTRGVASWLARDPDASTPLLLRRPRGCESLQLLGQIERTPESAPEPEDLSEVRRRPRHLANERAQVVRGVQAVSLREESQELQLVIRQEQVEAVGAVDAHGAMIAMGWPSLQPERRPKRVTTADPRSSWTPGSPPAR